jgi:polyphosphate kinase
MGPESALHSTTPPRTDWHPRTGHDARFLDGDTSFVQFVSRVVDLARDAETPPAERAKFLAIAGGHIDEFLRAHGARLAARGRDPHGVVEALVRLGRAADRHWRVSVRPALVALDVEVTAYAALTAGERSAVDAYVRTAVLPNLHPCPWDRASDRDVRTATAGTWMLVRSGLTRPDPAAAVLLRVPERPASFIVARPAAPGWPARVVPLEEAIVAHLGAVLPDVPQPIAHPCCTVRRSPSPETGRSGGTPEAILRADDEGPAVAALVDARLPAALVPALGAALRLPEAAVVRTPRPFALRRLWELHTISPAGRRFPPLPVRVPTSLAGGDLFSALRAGDALLHHPFDSFEPVERLLWQAAADPQVCRIRMTLYRTDRTSPVVKALMAAARRGATVEVLVELRARGDERQNATAALDLAESGVRVVHGPPGMKVHAKLMVIDRMEGSGLRGYAHVSSGNYSRSAAGSYTDLALMTSDPVLVRDLARVCDAVMQGTAVGPLRRVAASPTTLRRRLMALIEREAAHARRGRPSRIVLKMNALVDREIIRALYEASKTGVPIDLLVRGTCCARPGVAGVSDRIRVRSAVGRLLEHSRVWYFHNGGADEVFIGSADLMPRNLEHRVEIMVPVDALRLRQDLRSILTAYLHDTANTRELGPDGTFAPVRLDGPSVPFDVHAAFAREDGQ